MQLVWLVLLASLVAVPACKGDRVKCEKAARNFAKLTYWKKADAEIAQLPAAEQASARKKKLSQYTHELESGIDMVTEQCVSANNDEQVDCMIKAKTAEQVSKCADLAGSD